MLNNSHVFFREVIYKNYNFIQTFLCVVYCRVAGTCIAPKFVPGSGNVKFKSNNNSRLLICNGLYLAINDWLFCLIVSLALVVFYHILYYVLRHLSSSI